MVTAKYFEIALSGLQFHAYHGVLPQETKIGNRFDVDLTLKIPFDAKIANDNLEASVNYAEVYEIIADEMKKPKKLMETVATAISERIISKFPQILSGAITICKSTPPIPGITGSAKITLIF